jgi:methionyl-tRNA formyltransferase
MRVIFFGTPACAVPYLAAIREMGADLVAVVTQPDKPKGRSKQLCPPPVKEAAEAEQICLLQPETCRTPDFIARLADLEPDILLVVAYGRILCPALLAVPRVAALNIHYSLLPAFRGAAPVQHALLAGLAETGVTLQHLSEELDAGDIVAQATLQIAEDHSTETLMARLTDLGVALVKAQLPAVCAGTAPRRAQIASMATVAPRLTKQDGLLNLEESATSLSNRIRAVTPWPGAVVCLRGQRLQIRQARPVLCGAGAVPGDILALDPQLGPVIATGDGALELLSVQPLGKKVMSGADYLRGARLTLADRFESGQDC